ncbi:hypothetical protein DLAC_04923 [Tieghemostelium lacteum]|uniref:Uncharacterized protein n=1 Tax=Tieghemostelium lacteum TaxID=361077 RepID=A0A151ZIZ4_TIELA|nr:hypothetical protein DLAC_04923 [Tieghemostelium lacteum]|eukprot:KYQ93926.1 hypothetical protein DLAC_04923 [Tieghemostelium lacteum]
MDDQEQYYTNLRLIDAAKRGESESVEEYILDPECKPDINAKDSNGDTPLHWAARNGHDDVIKVLVKYKADVNILNNSKETPLHKAAWKNNLEAVRALVIDGRANVAILNKDGSTALQLAREVEVRKLLVPREDTSKDTEIDPEDSDNE